MIDERSKYIICVKMADYLFVIILLLGSTFGSECHANEIDYEGDSNAALNINIGILLPGDNGFPYSLAQVTPGVRVALASDRFKALLPNVTTNVKIMDSECSTLIAPLRAMETMVTTDTQQPLNLLLGPGCDLVGAPVARYNTQWQTCMMSAGCGATGFRDKKEYFVTRLLLNFEESGMVFGKIISSQYKFRRIIMLTQDVDDGKDCFFINMGVGKYFQQHFTKPENQFVDPSHPNFTQYLTELNLHEKARDEMIFQERPEKGFPVHISHSILVFPTSNISVVQVIALHFWLLLFLWEGLPTVYSKRLHPLEKQARSYAAARYV